MGSRRERNSRSLSYARYRDSTCLEFRRVQRIARNDRNGPDHVGASLRFAFERTSRADKKVIKNSSEEHQRGSMAAMPVRWSPSRSRSRARARRARRSGVLRQRRARDSESDDGGAVRCCSSSSAPPRFRVCPVAVATSIVATLILNYFFLPPIGTFTIADPQNWVALVTFVVTAVVASQLSSAAQHRTREAVDSRREVARLFDLSRDILLTTDSDGRRAGAGAARRDEGSISRRSRSAFRQRGGWTIHQGGRARDYARRGGSRPYVRPLEGGLEYDARQRTYGGIAQAAHDHDAR